MGANRFADDRMKHDEYRQCQESWREIRCALQLAEHTIVHGMLESQEMPIMMNVSGTVLALDGGISSLCFAMVVKRNSYHHWHIDQQQKPSCSEPFII